MEGTGILQIAGRMKAGSSLGGPTHIINPNLSGKQSYIRHIARNHKKKLIFYNN